MVYTLALAEVLEVVCLCGATEMLRSTTALQEEVQLLRVREGLGGGDAGGRSKKQSP